MKPTLDKDLDKITRVEEATLHVTQQLAGLGAGFMFVVLAAIFAGAFVTGTDGSVIIIAAVAIGAYPDMEACIAEWVTPLLGAAEAPDPALVAAYDTLFPAFSAARQALPPAWDALARSRAPKGDLG